MLTAGQILVAAWVYVIPYIYFIFIYQHDAWWPIRVWAALNIIALVLLTTRQYKLTRQP